jgi:hypothetical protein
VVARHKGTSHLRNRRKIRKTLPFSKARRSHRRMRWLSVTLDNFCWGYWNLKINKRHKSIIAAL